MANEGVNKRKDKEATENRRRTINYVVIAALAALIVTVLFLAFGRSDKNTNNGQVQQPATTTEQVNTASGTSTGSSNNYNVNTSRPASSTTVNRPTTTTVNRPTTTTVNRPGSGTSSSSNNNGTYTGRTDVPHTTKMDVLNGTYKEDDNSSSGTSGRRGGTRRR